MPKAAHVFNTSRRAMLAGIATLSVPTAYSAPQANPDVQLIKACQAFDEYERQYVAVFENPAFTDDDLTEAECDRIDSCREPLLEIICKTPALTPAGHEARARTLALYAADFLKPRVLSEHLGVVPARMLVALMRDLTSGGVA